jgi:hypothetical protein
MVSAATPSQRVVMTFLAVCLIGASALHIRDLLRHGWLPYRFAPFALNAYWTSLTFLDPLAAILLLWRPSAGLLLALLIIASDVALNLFARFGLGLHLQPVALLSQILFLVAVVAAMFYVRLYGHSTRTI